jgi:hypothetical protein
MEKIVRAMLVSWKEREERSGREGVAKKKNDIEIIKKKQRKKKQESEKGNLNSLLLLHHPRSIYLSPIRVRGKNNNQQQSKNLNANIIVGFCKLKETSLKKEEHHSQ